MIYLNQIKARASIRVSGSERVFTGTVIHIATQENLPLKPYRPKRREPM